MRQFNQTTQGRFEGLKIRLGTCRLPCDEGFGASLCKGLYEGFRQTDGLVVGATHFTDVRALVLVQVLSFQFAKQFTHSGIGQLLMPLSGQPCHHLASGRRSLGGHQDFLIPTKMALQSTEPVNVLDALEEFIVGFHDGFMPLCFFNTPMHWHGETPPEHETKKHTFKNI